MRLTDYPPDKTHVQRKLRYQRLYLHTRASVNFRNMNASKTDYLRVTALRIRATNEDRHDWRYPVWEVVHSSICEILATYQSQDDVQSRHRNTIRQSKPTDNPKEIITDAIPAERHCKQTKWWQQPKNLNAHTGQDLSSQTPKKQKMGPLTDGLRYHGRFSQSSISAVFSLSPLLVFPNNADVSSRSPLPRGAVLELESPVPDTACGCLTSPNLLRSMMASGSAPGGSKEFIVEMRVSCV